MYLVGVGGTEVTEQDLRSKLQVTVTGPDDSQLCGEDYGMDDQSDRKP